MRPLAAVAVLLALALPSADAGEESRLTLSARDCSYTVTTPRGWKLINASFADAVFYPSAQTYGTTPVFLYTRSTHKEALKVKTIEDLNALDLRGMRQRWPSIRSQRLSELPIADRRQIPFYSFTGGQFLERVAYAEHPKTITVFVVSAENEQSLESAMPAYRSLVASYRWVSDVSAGN
jgi:hypothetical protein